MRKSNKFKKILLGLIATIIFLSSIYYIGNAHKRDNIIFSKDHVEIWENNLYTPTKMEKISGDYFIVDCWHHRIIYSDNLSYSIDKWNTLTKDIKGGHSIASDGQLYLIDDTDNSMIRVFKKENGKFNEVKAIENITGRPHYIMYDENTALFYAISSQEGKIYTLKNDSGTLRIINTHIINEIAKSYVRSFNIIDGYMYFVSGPGYIYKVKYTDNSYEVIESYEVPKELVGMNFIEKIDGYFYISSYTDSEGKIAHKFIRIKDLNNLKDSNYEDLYEKFEFKGTPYYISKFDNKYFITEIDQSSGVKSFEVKDDVINNIKTLFYFEGHTIESENRKQSKY